MTCPIRLSLGILIGAFLTTTAPAGTITFTETGTVGGQPVNVSAELTTGLGTIEVVLNNLQTNPTSVIQALSDFGFFIDGNTNPDATLGSNTGTALTVNGDGTFSTGASVSTGWSLSTPSTGAFANGVYLNVLGTAIGPAHLILGPPNPAGNVYDNANGSIAGNGPHNPFLASGASFTINVAGVTSNTVSGVIFSFGTTAGDNLRVTARVVVVEVVEGMPEPISMVLMGAGLITIGLGRWRMAQ